MVSSSRRSSLCMPELLHVELQGKLTTGPAVDYMSKMVKKSHRR
jgi:hypothetical protein